MKRRLSAVSAWVLLAGGLVIVATNVAQSASPSPSPNFSAYASGTAVHADVLQSGPGAPIPDKQLLGVEAAFSGAALHNGGASTSQIVNEMKQEVQPDLPAVPADPNLPGQISYGRGSGLDVNIGSDVPVVNPPTLPIPDVARVSDGHTGPDPKTVDLANLPVGPLLYANLLRGQASATADGAACGDNPFGQGLGRAADVQILDTDAVLPPNPNPFPKPLIALDTNGPERGVVQTRSTTQLVPLGDHQGVSSEVRETIAPVTLFKNTDNQITIEVLGEWVLSTESGGSVGSSSIKFGPEPPPNPTDPILRILQGPPGAQTTAFELSFDQFIAGGFPSHIDQLKPLADIFIGEQPRTIGTDDAPTPAVTNDDGTTVTANAAADVVRVKVLQDTVPGAGGHVADVRIGHMESRVAVPDRGIPCPPPTTTTAAPTTTTTAAPTTTTTAPPTPCTGSATGTDVHADLIQTGPAVGGTQVLGAETAFTGASVRTFGASPQHVNEMNQEYQPPLPDKSTPPDPLLAGSLAYGRGSGLDVNIAAGTPVVNPPSLPLPDVARVSAPDNHGLQTAEVLAVPAGPLLYASLLRGEALATTDGSDPLQNANGNGFGRVAQVQVLDPSAPPMSGPLAAPLLDVQAAQSNSNSKLVSVPAGGGDPAHIGVTSEVRETIAPITLFKGMPSEITIKVLGEWVLTATANGTSATPIHYGPDPGTDPSAPVIQVFSGGTLAGELTFQQLLMQDGLDIPLGPLGDIRIGQRPHVIGDPAKVAAPATATNASAAADVVQVHLLEGVPAGGHILDLRIGHMEVTATAPDHGCPTPPPIGPTTTTTSTTTPTPTTAPNPPTTAPNPPTTAPNPPTTEAPNPPAAPTAPAQPSNPPPPPPPPPSQPANPSQPAPPASPANPVSPANPANPVSPANPTGGAVQPANFANVPQAQVLANTFTRPEAPAATAVQANPTFTG
jgi:hypothetical protein